MVFNAARDIPKLRMALEELRSPAVVRSEIEFSDGLASDDDISAAEKALGVRLPESYRELSKSFCLGAGAFGVVYSCNPAGSYFLGAIHNELKGWLPGDLIAFADNGCGDYFCFPVHNGECGDSVVIFLHDEEPNRRALGISLPEYVQREIESIWR